MARENRTTEAIVNSRHVDALIAHGKTYRFFQALRLLELSETIDSEKGVRIRPSLNLAFPGNDIDSITRTTDNKYLITANFFGLYGVSSPLPTFYTEDLISEKLDGKTSMRDFLDIIHAKYYPLLFQAWKKNRLWLSIDESQKDKEKTLNHLLSFVGLSYNTNDCDDVQADHRSLISFAGLFSHYPRSVAGLQTLLSGLLDGPRVDVIPCIEELVDIPKDAYCLLGKQGNHLGESSVLGDKVNQRSNRFDIVIGPLTQEQFDNYLPHKRQLKSLIYSIKHYCSHHYSFKIKLLIYQPEREPVEIGENWNSLGVNTWLDTKADNANVVNRKPKYNMILVAGSSTL